jgi:hypothetical protein
LTTVSLKAFFLMEEAALHCLPKEKKSSRDRPFLATNRSGYAEAGRIRSAREVEWLSYLKNRLKTRISKPSALDGKRETNRARRMAENSSPLDHPRLSILMLFPGTLILSANQGGEVQACDDLHD